VTPADAAMGERELCPHMGFVVVPVPKPKALIRPGEMPMDMQSVMQPCQRERCKMWNAAREDCGFNVQTALMEEIVAGLAPLQKMFGGK
jgi:hypothetical protein